MPFDTLDAAALDRLFRSARTQNGWLDEPVPEAKLRELYELCKWGPTTANTQPMRVLFLTTRSPKERLKPMLSPGNREKTMQAPVVAILGLDLEFYEGLGRMFPHEPGARSWFAGKDDVADTALRNASLQAGYFILAARAVGLDCGPMSGFDAAAVDREFWWGTKVRTNLVCALGRGDPARVHPRGPRYAFDEACRIL